MAENFRRWDQYDVLEDMLLLYYFSEDKIRVREPGLPTFRDRVAEARLKCDELTLEFESLKGQLKSVEEDVSAAEKKLYSLEREAVDEFKLNDYIRGCGEGIICETVEDVKAFHKLMKVTQDFKKFVVVDPKCPNYREIWDEGVLRKLSVKDLTASENNRGSENLKLWMEGG